jgi:hypothetical protein
MNSSLKTNKAINLGRTGQAVIPPSKPADAKRKPAPSRFTLDGRKMSVVVLIEPAALEAYLPELKDLAANVIEANIFYEPWILWPSLKAFGQDRQFFLALVFAPTLDNPHAPQTLCGFFPLVRERRRDGGRCARVLRRSLRA